MKKLDKLSKLGAKKRAAATKRRAEQTLASKNKTRQTKTSSLTRAVFNKGYVLREKEAYEVSKEALFYTASRSEIEAYVASGHPIKEVAIIGLPNVGKSSLFNALNKSRIAIISPIAGTTRDIKYSYVSLKDEQLNTRYVIKLVDTGGFDLSTPLFKDIAGKTLALCEDISLALFLVDGNRPFDEEELGLYRRLSKGIKTLLLVNKIDNEGAIAKTYDFASYGARDVLDISVLTKRNFKSLLAELIRLLDLRAAPCIDTSDIDMGLEGLLDSYALLDEGVLDEGMVEGRAEGALDARPKVPYIDEIARAQDRSHKVGDKTEDKIAGDKIDTTLGATSLEEQQSILASKDINIAIIGRVNVGKSSILNALTNTSRSVVSPIAGTTMDTVDEQIEYKGRTLCFIDTAGIRARGKIQGLERYALERTSSMLKQSDVAILVLDASQGFVKLDEKISSLALVNSLGVIVVLNKWDIKKGSYEEVLARYRHSFKHLSYASVITTSALTLRNVEKIKDEVLKVYANYCFKVGTARLNAIFNTAFARHQIPSDHGKIVRVYYSAQISIAPPRFAIVSNRPSSIHFSYKRYLINTLREHFDFSGVPLEIVPKARGRGEVEAEE